MKRTIIAALILSLAFSVTAAAEHAESEAPAVTHRTSAAPADYVPEPKEEIITERRIPEGEQGRGENLNLNYAYGQSGYPDYLSYVEGYDKFLNENNETIILYRVGITDMSRENMDEVLDFASDRCYITFEPAPYSYNERMEVFYMLREQFPDLPLIEDWQEKQFILVTDAEGIEAVNSFLGERYTDLVFACDTDGSIYDRSGNPTGRSIDISFTGMGGEPVIGGDMGVDVIPEEKSVAPIIAVTAVLVLLLVGGGLLLRRNTVRLGSDGSAAAAAVLSTADVKRLIADSAESPRKELRDRILNL